MIFGFNTDVRYGDTVFHVQSEPRLGERLLETQVFVGGLCLGKRAISYADRADRLDFSDEQVQELLRAQHRAVIEAAREGQLHQMLGAPLHHGSGDLRIEWLNARSAGRHDALVMRLRTSSAGSPVAGATIIARLNLADGSDRYFPALTDEAGTAEITVALEPSTLGGATVLVQAVRQGMSGTRKFNLRKLY
jgi:hypothetical protein